MVEFVDDGTLRLGYLQVASERAPANDRLRGDVEVRSPIQDHDDCMPARISSRAKHVGEAQEHVYGLAAERSAAKEHDVGVGTVEVGTERVHVHVDDCSEHLDRPDPRAGGKRL